VKLTVIGCSGSAPGPGTAASCYLVEAGGYRLVLDLGSGALAALQRLVRVDELDAIFLSHLHPDHCVDMASLAVILRYGSAGDNRFAARAPIPVIGPPASAEHLLDVYYPGSPPSTFTGLFEFQTPDAHQLGPFTVRTVPVLHPVPAFAVRVEANGRSLVYSGDTAACPALVELARGADVLLCEAAWAGSPPPVAGIHLSGREAGEHAAQAGVGQLLVTHVPAWESVEAAVTGARETYEGDVVGVAAGDTYEI
jgi:ribonuclease BN (tRNA processing enzyme)